jgi:hypothetical protein
MVFVPEACDFIGEKRSQLVDNAELENGETVRSFCLMAEQNNVWLSLGGILEKVNIVTVCTHTHTHTHTCPMADIALLLGPSIVPLLEPEQLSTDSPTNSRQQQYGGRSEIIYGKRWSIWVMWK